MRLNIDTTAIVAAFAKIPKQAAKNMRVAMKVALIGVKDYAADNHEYTSRTGAADRAYKITVAGNGMSGELALDPKISGAPYVIPLHEGHKKFWVFPFSKKALYWVKGGGEYFSKGHTIPKKNPDRWLPRALKAKTPDAVKVIEKAIAVTIKEAGL